MTLYRAVQIHDGSCANDERLADFVDSMDEESRRELVAAKQRGGQLELTWRRETPFLWDRHWIHLEFRDGSFDEWSICNRPYGAVHRSG